MTQQQVPVPAPLRAEGLRGLCGGSVHLPGDSSYDMARAPWNLQVSDFPAAVAYPVFPDEVADVLRAARAAGLAVAVQGTGHGAPPLQGRLTTSVKLGIPLQAKPDLKDYRVDGTARVPRLNVAGLQLEQVTSNLRASGWLMK